MIQYVSIDDYYSKVLQWQTNVFPRKCPPVIDKSTMLPLIGLILSSNLSNLYLNLMCMHAYESVHYKKLSELKNFNSVCDRSLQ